MTSRWKFAAYLRDQSGVAAIEFAMIVPVLAAIVIGAGAVVPFVQANDNMHDAVSAGARYVMAGGTDPASIQNVTLSAWTGHSASASVTVTKSCTCAGVTSPCTSLCTDATVPQGYTVIAASSPYVGALAYTTITTQQTLRTR